MNTWNGRATVHADTLYLDQRRCLAVWLLVQYFVRLYHLGSWDIEVHMIPSCVYMFRATRRIGDLVNRPGHWPKKALGEWTELPVKCTNALGNYTEWQDFRIEGCCPVPGRHALLLRSAVQEGRVWDKEGWCFNYKLT